MVNNVRDNIGDVVKDFACADEVSIPKKNEIHVEAILINEDVYKDVGLNKKSDKNSKKNGK